MKNKNLRPIRLERLEAGSTCSIFAEPSRGIYKSKDTTVWLKETDNTVLIDATDAARCAILMPTDLVVPLSRPKKERK